MRGINFIFFYLIVQLRRKFGSQSFSYPKCLHWKTMEFKKTLVEKNNLTHKLKQLLTSHLKWGII